MASKTGSRLAIAMAIAATLVGCGGNTPTQPASAYDSSASNYGTTSYGSTAYGSTAYGSTSNGSTYGYSGSPTGSGVPSVYGSSSPYGEVPCGGTPSGSSASEAQVPGLTICGSSSTSSGGTSGSTATATDSTGAATPGGFAATITATQTTGIFTKSVLGVSVQVVNNDAQEETHYVIVSFTLDNNEVGVAYHQVDLTPGAQQTLQFPIPTDSSGHDIQADSAHVEVADSLL